MHTFPTTATKRKSTDDLHVSTKHVRVDSDAPAPEFLDVEMSSDDLPSSESTSPAFFTSALPNAGSSTTASPVDDLPNPFPTASVNQVGLLQPASHNGLVHNGSDCTQIPRLRVSSFPGLNGSRTMWSHCQQCGAIEMVSS